MKETNTCHPGSNQLENQMSKITDPGKFEGCNVYIPYFYEMMLEGKHDDEEWPEDENDDTLTFVFEVTDTDVASFPVLKDKVYIKFYEDEDGFIHEV